MPSHRSCVSLTLGDGSGAQRSQGVSPQDLTHNTPPPSNNISPRSIEELAATIKNGACQLDMHFREVVEKPLEHTKDLRSIREPEPANHAAEVFTRLATRGGFYRRSRTSILDELSNISCR